MTEDGRITIPADVRRRLNWTPGKAAFLQITTDATNINSFTGRPRAPYVGIDQAVRNHISRYGIDTDGRTTDEWMKELREGERE